MFTLSILTVGVYAIGVSEEVEKGVLEQDCVDEEEELAGAFAQEEGAEKSLVETAEWTLDAHEVMSVLDHGLHMPGRGDPRCPKTRPVPHPHNPDWLKPSPEYSKRYQKVMRDLDRALSNKKTKIEKYKSKSKHADARQAQKEVAVLYACQKSLEELLCLEEIYTSTGGDEYAAESAECAQRYADFTVEKCRPVILGRSPTELMPSSGESFQDSDYASENLPLIMKTLKANVRRASMQGGSTDHQSLIDNYGLLNVFDKVSNFFKTKRDQLIGRHALDTGSSIDDIMPSIAPHLADAYNNLIKIYAEHFDIRILVQRGKGYLHRYEQDSQYSGLDVNSLVDVGNAGFTYVRGKKDMHCADKEQLEAPCGRCGPHQINLKMCAELCVDERECKFFTFFHDDGCRIYRSCDYASTDWLVRVSMSIFKRD
jgi:hypothetical protein